MFQNSLDFASGLRWLLVFGNHRPLKIKGKIQKKKMASKYFLSEIYPNVAKFNDHRAYYGLEDFQEGSNQNHLRILKNIWFESFLLK